MDQLLCFMLVFQDISGRRLMIVSIKVKVMSSILRNNTSLILRNNMTCLASVRGEGLLDNTNMARSKMGRR